MTKPYCGLLRYYFTVPTDNSWGTLHSGVRRYEQAGGGIFPYRKQTRELDLGRLPTPKRIKPSPLLTKSYLFWTPAPVREAMRAEADLLVAQYFAASPPGPAPMPRKRGRPPKGDRAMTGAERARKHYYAHKAPPPQGRVETGADQPPPLRLAAPVNPYAEIEQLMIATFLEFQQAEHYRQRLGEILDRLADAPPDYCLTREEFKLVAMAAAFQRATNRREVH
jgi:hypothetical protein